MGSDLRRLAFHLRLLLQDDRQQFGRTELSQFPSGHAVKCTLKPHFFQPPRAGFFCHKTK